VQRGGVSLVSHLACLLGKAAEKHGTRYFARCRRLADFVAKVVGDICER